ncbi:MAG: PD40 domain-containing protein [Fibrobacteres bacterium]|nr:PD40 domain-containing protein [Fibrobacterota bacterium]
MSTLARFCLFVAFLAIHAWSYGDQEQDRNHPEVQWFTSETPHFRFHYEAGLRPAAEACAARAEAVYPILTELFGHEPSAKTEFLVFDEDYSNGWAIASLNTMAIWSSDMGFELRGSKDWIRDVVAHEFTHVVSIQAGAKAKPWLSELQLGWDDASDRATTSGGWLLWSLSPYSMAMAEGASQWGSERTGGDAWDSHRAMIQRTAAQSDSLLSWSRMGTFSGSGLDGERVYGQGYSLVRHIERTRGAEWIPKWWRELSKWKSQTPGGAWKSLTGQSGAELWNEWRDSAKSIARREIEAAKPLVQGRRLFGEAFHTQWPRWWNDTLLLFSSNRGSDFQVNSLWAWDLGDKDTTKRSWVVAPVIRTRVGLDTAGKRVWFHSGREDDSRGRPVLDLYQASVRQGENGQLEADAKPKQKRVTRELHAFAPDFHGDSLLTVVRDLVDFRLRVVPVDSSGPGRELYPGAGNSSGGTIFGAVWSPGGDTVAIDRFDGRSRRVDLLDRKGNFLVRIGDSLADWRTPTFSPDGRQIVLASDRTGIFNLYRHKLSSGALEQLTSEPGGAFQPAVSPDGKRLAYIAWDRDGYGLNLLDSIVPIGVRPERIKTAITPPLQESWDLSGGETPYFPVPTRFLLSPILFAQRAQPMFGEEGLRWKGLAGARFQALDPVRRNTVVLLGLLDVGNGFDYVQLDQPTFLNPRQEKMFLAGWENRSLVPTIFAEAGWQNVRGQDTSSTYSDDSRDTVARKRIVQPWALEVGSLLAGARWSVTRNQKLHGEISWAGYEFNLYEGVPFRFPAYSSWAPAAMWTYLSKDMAADESMADQRGVFARVKVSHEISKLQRSGSFSEVFQQNANGSVTVKTASTDLQRAMVDLRLAVGNPLWEEQSFELDVQGSGILHWQSDADTLNDFYLEGLSIPGYPAFAAGKGEERLFQGTRSAYTRLATRFPLVKMRNGFWIWFFDQWSAGASVQAGRAWRGDVWDFDASPREQFFDFSRSWTVETRLAGRIHSAYPFHLSVGLSRALDQPKGLTQKTATIFGIPTFAHRIEFGLNTGLDEWAIIDQSLRRLGLLPAPRRLH